MRFVQVETAVGGAEDRDPPVAGVRELDEPLQQLAEPRRRPDRVTGDDRDAADDLVGEEGGLVLGEEVRLVPAQDERRERVDPPRGHERPRQLPLPCLLAQPVAPRGEPRDEEPGRAREGDEEDRLREPHAELSGEVRGAA